MRRWLIRIALLVVALAVAAGATWALFGRRIATAALARVLPLSFGHGVTLARIVDPRAVAAPAVVITATPERARELVGGMLEHAVPPGAIGHGLTVDGRLDLPELAPELPLGLRLRADAGLASPPLIEARLPTAAVNALIARVMREAAAAGELPVAATPILDPGAVLEDSGDAVEKNGVVERRFRFAASGRVLVGGDVARISALAGQIVVTSEARRRDYAARCAVAIERLDYDPPASWPRSLLPADPRPLLTSLVNARLAQLEPLPLPLWTPFDARVRVLVEGPDASAPAPAPTPTPARDVY